MCLPDLFPVSNDGEKEKQEEVTNVMHLTYRSTSKGSSQMHLMKERTSQDAEQPHRSNSLMELPHSSPYLLNFCGKTENSS